MQDLGELIPALLQIKAKADIALKFHVRMEVGDNNTRPSDAVVQELNKALKELGEDFRVN
jgi:hypothetical protein